MAALVSGMPIFSLGKSISRSPRYKRTSRGRTHPVIVRTRKEPRSANTESRALEKIGAFGVSVKRTQQTPEASNDSDIAQVDETPGEVPLYENLPGVEISINKKIKKRIMIRHAENQTDPLTHADKLVLEDLRKGLLTRPDNVDIGGARSLLEAMGDPKIRESRMFYEPLTKFRPGDEKASPTSKAKNQLLSRVVANSTSSQRFSQELQLISLPPTQRHFNTPVDQVQATGSTPSQKISRNSTKHGYPLFPKMATSLFNSKSERAITDKPRKPHQRDARNQIQYSLAPTITKNADDNVAKIDIISLPSISLNIQTTDGLQESDLSEPVNENLVHDQDVKSHQHANHPPKNIPPPPKRPAQFYRGKIDHHQNSSTVNRHSKNATGKSRLIGPMNKMDMIAEYSTLLKKRIIDYDQYIKKISKLSLHKIDLENSGMRHYHVVRDRATGAKHRLARVDIYPEHPNHSAVKENIPRQMNDDPYKTGRKTDTDLTKYRKATTFQPRMSAARGTRTALTSSFTLRDTPTYKASQTRLSRVSIGEDIPESRFEHFASGYDVAQDDFLTYDDITRMQGNTLDRYQGAHRPNIPERRFYNWIHIPAPSQGGTQGMDHQDGDLYNGYSGKPLPNSREIKERLAFSYPSYDTTQAGNDATRNPDGIRVDIASSFERGKVDDSSHDPDYLAISLDQPAKSSSTERVNVTSSLSIHDVKLPAEMSVVSGRSSQKAIAGNQVKGLVLGAREPVTKLKESESREIKNSIESLNITPVAITSSPAVNPNRSLNKPAYYISQDDFAATGTDGVLQNHLTTIYKSISRAKTRGRARVSPRDQSSDKTHSFKEVTSRHSNNKPLIAQNENIQPGSSSESDERAKVEGHSYRQKSKSDEEPATIKVSVPDSASLAASVLIPSREEPQESPPPTAFILKSREEETTSIDSEDGGHEFRDVISVNVTAAAVDGSA